MAKQVYVLNGPNLNLLGQREPEIYGHATLADVERLCTETAAAHGFGIRFLQSNAEHQLIDWIHEARSEAAAIIINPAALSHYSIGLLDALCTFERPIVEVHISQIHRREDFRHLSYVSKRADAVICGCGTQGYALALEHVAAKLG